MLEVSFINGTALLIEDYDNHLTGFTAYSGCYQAICMHDITAEDLDSLINALMSEEFRRQVEAVEK